MQNPWTFPFDFFQRLLLPYYYTTHNVNTNFEKHISLVRLSIKKHTPNVYTSFEYKASALTSRQTPIPILVKFAWNIVHENAIMIQSRNHRATIINTAPPTNTRAKRARAHSAVWQLIFYSSVSARGAQIGNAALLVTGFDPAEQWRTRAN